MTPLACRGRINRLTEAEYLRLKAAFENACAEVEDAAAKFDAAAACDQTSKNARVYDAAAITHDAAVAKLKAARADIEVAVKGAT